MPPRSLASVFGPGSLDQRVDPLRSLLPASELAGLGRRESLERRRPELTCPVCSTDRVRATCSESGLTFRGSRSRCMTVLLILIEMERDRRFDVLAPERREVDE
jgi:hypothetical protein